MINININETFPGLNFYKFLNFLNETGSSVANLINNFHS